MTEPSTSGNQSLLSLLFFRWVGWVLEWSWWFLGIGLAPPLNKKPVKSSTSNLTLDKAKDELKKGDLLVLLFGTRKSLETLDLSPLATYFQEVSILCYDPSTEYGLSLALNYSLRKLQVMPLFTKYLHPPHPLPLQAVFLSKLKEAEPVCIKKISNIDIEKTVQVLEQHIQESLVDVALFEIIEQGLFIDERNLVNQNRIASTFSTISNLHDLASATTATSIIKEQNSAYERSLAADRAKTKKKEDEKNIAENTTVIIDTSTPKLRLLNTLPSEPLLNDPLVLKLSIQLPDGKRVQRFFKKTDSISLIYLFVECHVHRPFVVRVPLPSSESLLESDKRELGQVVLSNSKLFVEK